MKIPRGKLYISFYEILLSLFKVFLSIDLVSGKKVELDEVRLHLAKGIGLAISVPNAEIYLNDSIVATNTIID